MPAKPKTCRQTTRADCPDAVASFNGSAKDYIMSGPGRPKQDSMSISDLRKTIRSGAVLFYPACGFDWLPIQNHLFSDCQTFLYCDWRIPVGDFEEGIKGRTEAFRRWTGEHYPPLTEVCHAVGQPLELEPRRLVDPPLIAYPKFLRREERARYQREFGFSNKHPWCRWLPAIQTEGQDRKLDLVYLSVEGVSAYWKLFNRQRTAPKCLCIQGCGDGFGGNYTSFYRWGEPLGRAVLAGWLEHGCAPDLLVTERDHDWPWTEVVGHVNEATVYARSKGLTAQDAERYRKPEKKPDPDDLPP